MENILPSGPVGIPSGWPVMPDFFFSRSVVPLGCQTKKMKSRGSTLLICRILTAVLPNDKFKANLAILRVHYIPKSTFLTIKHPTMMPAHVRSPSSGQIRPVRNEKALSFYCRIWCPPSGWLVARSPLTPTSCSSPAACRGSITQSPQFPSGIQTRPMIDRPTDSRDNENNPLASPCPLH